MPILQTVPSDLKTIVYRNAPFLMAETWIGGYDPPGAVDHMLRVDFDGTAYGPGKAAHAANRSLSVDRTATAYFSAIETGYTSDQGWYFLGYYWYHPRDDGFYFCAPFPIGCQRDIGHEHDMEGVLLAVRKSAFTPYGTLVASFTQAHGAIVPYLNTYQSLVTTASSQGSPWAGQVEFWDDPRYSSRRPVVAVRAWSHGTHMAQDVNRAEGYGMVQNTGMGATYPTYPHDDSDVIVYRPMMEEALNPANGLPGASVLSIDTTHLVANYQLLELSQSALWSNRSTFQNLFAGSSQLLTDGSYALPSFYSTIDPDQANPPWQWRGGEGCHTEFGNPYCWYTFGVDGTSSWDAQTYWPTSSSAGKFLMFPNLDLMSRTSGMPGLDAPHRYNPYISSPPNYYGAQPLYGSISGLEYVGHNSSHTWNAVASYGTAPYTYQWSGIFSGTSASITGTVEMSGDLFLDVYDAAGQHVSVALYVTDTGCPGTELSC